MRDLILLSWRAMRTTLDIDADLPAAARELAKRQRKTKRQHGFRPIPAGRAPITNAMVNDMRDKLGI